MRKKAFGLLQAIAMILLLSGMMVVVLKYAAISTKHIADSYVQEQAELYLNSVVEQALLDISEYNRSSGTCFNSNSYSIPINHGKEYSASVEINRYYMLNESCSNVDVTTIGSSESHGMVLMNVEVNATIDGVLKTRILRRTLQRP